MNTDLYRKVEVTDNHGNKRIEDQFDPSGVLMIAVVGLLAIVLFVVATPFVALLWFYFSGHKKLAKFQNQNIKIYKIISLISVTLYTALLGLILLAHTLPDYKFSNTLPEAKIIVEDILNIPADITGIVYVAIAGIIFILVFFLVYYIHNRMPKMIEKTVDATVVLKQGIDTVTKPIRTKIKTKSLKKRWVSILLLLITASIAVVGWHRLYLRDYLIGTFFILLSSNIYLSWILFEVYQIAILQKVMQVSVIIILLVFIFELFRLLFMSNEKFQTRYNPVEVAVTS